MNKNSRWMSPLIVQMWTVSGVFLSILGQGLMMGFPACLLPALQGPDSPIKADLATASWFASVAGIANLIGTVSASILTDMFGRRRPYFLYIVPEIIGWILIYFANDIPMLMIGRILGTISGGALASIGPIVIGEYTSPKYRGMFLTLKTAAFYLGITIVHILGSYFHWKTIAIFGMVPQISAFLIVLTWRESPSWLVKKGEYEKSEKIFFWLRGEDEDAKKELQDLFRAHKVRYFIPNTLNLWAKLVKSLMLLTRKGFVKPLLIIFICGFVIESCGRHVFPTYAIQIVEEITGDRNNSYYFTLGIDLLITTSVVMSSLLVRLLKRRTLLLSSGLAAAVVLLCACAYLFLESRNETSKNHPYITVILFTVYFILANLGCTTIPIALLGELFPLAHRGAGVALSGIILSLFFMLNLKVTPYLLASIKVYGTFAIFAIILTVMLCLLYLILPETKDRTLQEIEDYFNDGHFKDIIEDDDIRLKMIKQLRYRKITSATIYQVFFTKILRLECAIRLRAARVGRVHSGHLPHTHGCRLLIPTPSPKNALLIELHKLNVPCSTGFIRFAPNTPPLCGKLEQIPSQNRKFLYSAHSKSPAIELHGRPTFAATYRLVDHCHDVLLTARNGSFEVGPAIKLICSYKIHLPYGNRVALRLQMGTGPMTARENDVSNIIHEDTHALCRGMELSLEDGESKWKHCSQPGDPLRSVQIVSERNSVRLNISVLAKKNSSAMWLKVWWMDKAVEEIVGHCDYGWVASEKFCVTAVREAKRAWRQAEAECVRLGGHLASILNERQQQITDQLLLHVPGAGVDDVYWIGATDAVHEGEFRWSDGLPFSYAHWFPGWRKHSSQPNDDGTSGQDCVEARREFPPRPPPAVPTFMWNDRGCREHNYFVCERPGVEEKNRESF